MADVAELRMDDLLAPLEGGAPCGQDLRYEGLYDSIRDLRQEDDANVVQGVWETDIRQADWAAVRRLAEEALTTRTKDLQIAAWLAEALAHQKGLEGLAEGIELMAGLADLFWDEVYPALDPEDEHMEARLAPLEWLGGRAQAVLSTLPFTRGMADGASYTWQVWLAARRLDALHAADGAAYKKAVAAGEVPMDRLRAAVSQTPTEFYEQWLAGLKAVAEALDVLKDVLGRRAGDSAPSFGVVLDQIAEMRVVISRHLADRGVATDEEEAGEDAADDGQDGVVVGTGRGGPLLSRPIATRQEAYTLLQAAANYLQATEPHSPTSYLVRRAVAWGEMSLTELLSELSRDSNQIESVFSLLRLRDG